MGRRNQHLTGRSLAWAGLVALTVGCWVALFFLLATRGLVWTAPVAAVLAISVEALVALLILAVQTSDGSRTADSLDAAARPLADGLMDDWQRELTLRLVDDRWIPIVCTSLDLRERGEPVESETEVVVDHGWDPRDLLTDGMRSKVVIVGDVGAGKTTLLVELVIQLLLQPGPHDKVPVLVSLGASWDPFEEDFDHWFERRLILDHPGLRAKAPAKAGPPDRSIAWALLIGKKLFPVLDGLDQLPLAVRAKVMTRLNQARSTVDGFVLSCRTEEFDALRRSNAPPLIVHDGFRVRPLSRRTAVTHLQRTAGNAVERWSELERRAGRSHVVWKALRTPLMVSLAQNIYNPRDPDEDIERQRKPLELLEKRSSKEIKSHLLSHYVEAVYRARRPGMPRRWNHERAERWLSFLAHHVETTGDETDFAWWRLEGSAPANLGPGTIGALCGVAVGVATLPFAILGVGLGAGLLVGGAVALVAHRLSTSTSTSTPARSGGVAGAGGGSGRPGNLLARRMVGGLAGALLGALAGGALGAYPGIGGADSLTSGVAGGAAVGLLVGLMVKTQAAFAGGLAGGLVDALLSGIGAGIVAGVVNGVALGLIVASVLRKSPRYEPAHRPDWSPMGWGWSGGIAAGIVVGLGVGAHAGLEGGLVAGSAAMMATALISGTGTAPADVAKADSPRTVYTRDRHTSWLWGLVGLVTGLASGMGVGLPNGQAVGLSVGLAAAFTTGLAMASLRSSTPTFTITRTWLALSGRLPFRLMPFLDDAHHRGVLHQVGAFYQFRHAELQRHLAQRYNETVGKPHVDPRRTRRASAAAAARNQIRVARVQS